MPITGTGLERGALALVVATLVAAAFAVPRLQDMPPAAAAMAGRAESDWPGGEFAIRDVRVFDGERVLPVATVHVRDGRIVAVGAGVDAPPGVAVVEGAGRTLLPGLVDAHAHAWGEAQAEMLQSGVTLGLDMHGDAARLPALRAQRRDAGNATRADLFAAGSAVTAAGGHGTRFGFPVPALDPDGDAAAFAAQRIAEGADFVKLIVEDMRGYGSVDGVATLDAAQVRDAIAAAHARDRIAVAHVSTAATAADVLDAGIDGLVHVFDDAPAGDAFVRAAASRDLFVVPTLSVIASIAGTGEGGRLATDPRLAPTLSAGQRAALGSAFPLPARPARLAAAIASVRRLHAAGVDILAGSDAPNPGTAHGVSLHGELALLVSAGLSPVEALAAATALPAERFGIADRGRIAAGQWADLLLVDGDPTRDITATRSIAAVWKNGHPVVRTAAPPATAETPALPLRIAGFDGGVIDASRGTWSVTTDRMAGGRSDATMALAVGGAAGSAGALAVRGELHARGAATWAGVAWLPGDEAMTPIDLTAATELVFHVRGDGRTYQAMLMSGDMQAVPAMQPFATAPGWAEVRLPLARFRGVDLAGVRAIVFAAAAPGGGFAFALDDVAVR